MPLTGIYGYCGSGKDLFEVIDCYYTPKEIPIYTNFKLNLKNAELIEPDEVFEVFEVDSKIPIKKMVTSEAYSWFESRGSGTSEINTFLSYLMFQSRKRGLNWVSIAQLRATLDLRWRGMEDRIVLAMERNLDLAGNSTDDFNYWLLKNNRKKKVHLSYEKAIPFFSLYDTREVIKSTEFNDLQLRMKNRKPENLDKYIDYLVEQLINRKFVYPVKTSAKGIEKYAITQEWVRDKLFKIGEGMEYSSPVKIRLLEKISF